MPAANIGLSFYARRWRESAARSLAMAFALLLHLALLLLLLRPALPWPLRRNPASTADHTLRVELLRRSKRVAVSATNVAPSTPLRPHVHSVSNRSAKAIPDVSTASAAAPPVASQPELSQPLSPPAAYGNSRFAHALDETQSSGLPRLPGTNSVSKVPGIVVAPPPSLKSRVQALGLLLRCKNAIFKRNLSDEELLKRGLTRMQMNQDYQAHCWP